MICRLSKLTELSGSMATIYSVLIEDDDVSLFEHFLQEQRANQLRELENIVSRLKIIGEHTGARSSFFKHNEGNPGDGLVALYDTPDKRLRLYAIRYGVDIVVLGGGGIKVVRALQEDSKLRYENYLLREIAKGLNESIQNKSIIFSEDRLEFEGDLEFEIEYYE